MEFLFDLERSVEAVEKRVPFGHFATRLLLSLAMFYGIVELSFALNKEVLSPLVSFLEGIVTRVFSGEPLLPTIRGIGHGTLKAIVIGFLIGSVWSAEAAIYRAMKGVQTTLERYQLIFWMPLTDYEKKKLTAKLAALGVHSASITACIKNPDCAQLAANIRECLEAATWQVTEIPVTGDWESPESHGFFLWLKIGAENFNKQICDAFGAATHSSIVKGLHDRQGDPDIQIVLGPKDAASNP